MKLPEIREKSIKIKKKRKTEKRKFQTCFCGEKIITGRLESE